MNIFFLDRDPKIAAQFHCDRHVIKMILESAQLLSTAHRLLDGVDKVHPDPVWNEVLYKATHANHPSAIWVRQSKQNYLWLWELTKELNKEYKKRYGHTADHKTIQKLENILDKPPKNIPDVPFFDPPQCMPEEYMHADTTEAYQNYYNGAKRDIAVWHNSETPHWF